MKKNLVKKIAVDAMLIALIIIMTFVPYVGFIPIPALGISITIIHIVVLLGAMIFGWKDGLLLGFVFGICSLLKALSYPGTLDYLFINPLVSVLPRVIFGGVSGLVFDLIRKLKKPSIVLPLFYVSSGVLTFFHSVLTLNCLYFLSFDKALMEQGGLTSYGAIIASIFTVSCLFEIIAAIIISPTLSLTLFKVFPELTRSPLMYKTNYEKLVEPYFDSCVESLKGFVSKASVYDETSIDDENPFGKGVSNALNWIADLARKDGFAVCNYQNKIVEIIYGEGAKNLTILAHADVVPATGNWTGDPFIVRENNGYLYGRGVSDDKGPCLAAYYAIKALRDNGLLNGYQVRLLVGGNEESGSLGMKYYFDELKKPQPTYGFTPDSDFPLIFAEKAITNFTIEGSLFLPGIDSFQGGLATNAVIDEVTIKLNDAKLMKFLIDDVKPNKILDENTIKILGKSAHGSTPWLGDNAALKAMKSIAKFYNDSNLIAFVDKISSLNGDGLHANYHSETMGDCSLNLGIVNFKNNYIRLVFNYRFVDGVDFNLVKENIASASMPYKVTFGEVNNLLYYPVKSSLISSLMKAYQEETNDKKSKPLAIGGGTYAKEAKNVVAFGMQFPNENTHMHEPDECVSLIHLKKAMSIYANAIIKLGDLIKNEN